MTPEEKRPTSVPAVADPEQPRRRWLRRLGLALGTFALVTLLASCDTDAPQNIFDTKGEGARKINGVQTPVFILAGIVMVLVFAAVLFLIIRFRARGAADERPVTQVHGKTWAEITWTAAPALILLVVSVFTVKLVIDLGDTPDNAMQIDVVGQQWWWEFTYPDSGVVTAGEMVIPVDTEVVLNITSRDVIHSFWFPKLNGKRDAVPNRVTQLSIKGEEVGEYYGQCTEFCGLSHANMRMRAIVLSQADYQTWLDNQEKDAAVPAEGTSAHDGYVAFGQRCSSCHSISGQPNQPGDVPLVPGVAPNLTHLMSRTTFAGASFPLLEPGCTEKPDLPTGTPLDCFDREKVEDWLRDPSAMKPMVPDDERGMPTLGLSETDIAHIVDYLSTLK
jgi:cytochrome c oxidase subunit 2